MLKGVKVLEFQGLAPSVFCGMYFADQGAQVIVVARPEPVPFSMEIHRNIMNRNKKCIALSLKDPQDKKVLIELIKTSHIIIDPFRPGVLEKQKLGPQDLYEINNKIILLRVTGYGQTGEMALKPGHDLNYISSSGILKLINKQNDKTEFPANYLADFVSASLGIVGTLKALESSKQSKKGSVVDCSLTGGCSYLTYLVHQEKAKQSSKRNYVIKYHELNGKRYVVIQEEQYGKNQENQISLLISKMQKQNKSFLKVKSFEIAEIRKVQKIEKSSLGNPFDEKMIDGMIKKIPSRDENRKQILMAYNLQTPKL